LVDLINRFGDLLLLGGSVPFADIEDLFGKLAAYAEYHFREEEGLMRRIGLDPRHIEKHKQAHTDFVEDVTALHQDAAQRPETSDGLLKFLTYWLAYHILGSDQSMAKQIGAVRSGQTPEKAYMAAEKMHEGATEPLLLALNGLFQQVSERNRQLKQLNSTLETKVMERTHSLADANLLLEQIALTDVLTGLPNRRQAMARLAQAWAQSERDASPLACMMIDADGFKLVNDRYGHAAGDEVLRQLSARLRAGVRGNDIVCRLGGDEFLIICLGTGLEGVLHAAEKTRQGIAKLRVPVDGGEWLGSVSVGVAVKTAGMQNSEDLIKAADEGLYMAKRKGRNCVAGVAG
jgi:hemerythrin